MKIYTLDYKKNNTEALDERLRAVFGERYVGMGSSDAGVWFEFKDDGAADDLALLEAELDAHDPEALSTRQEKARRKPDIKALREKMKAGRRDEVLSDILDLLEELQPGGRDA